MKKLRYILLIGFVGTLSFNSCSKSNTEKLLSDTGLTKPGLSISQARALAGLFAPLLESNVSPDDGTKTPSRSLHRRTIENIDAYVVDGDTLMFAVNYADNEGYILIGADYVGFPILSHSSIGGFKFDGISEDSPVNLFLDAYRDNINDKRLVDNASFDCYDNWKDLGKDGYEYEIEICPMDEVVETKARRKELSGRKTVHPYTGMELDYWCQDGGYNYYAENKARIGCPAIAVGMLMYDTHLRLSGNNTETSPLFYSSDSYDAVGIDETGVAYKLRQIADAIPNYSWGQSEDNESGAVPEDVLTGLHNLGYVNAMLVDYNFEKLYDNLSFKATVYGQETDCSRGVLLCAYSDNGGGHIWFCDGYYEQAYTVTKKFLGIKIKSWKEYDDRLYMNWGWGPNQGNGWYCATDNGYWSSLEHDSRVLIKQMPKMYINLAHYETVKP